MPRPMTHTRRLFAATVLATPTLIGLAAVGTVAVAVRAVAAAENDKPVGEALPDGLVLKAPSIPKAAEGTLRTLNERLSKDLNPVDNAGVFLVQAFGENAFEPELLSDTLDMMGIVKVSKTAPRFIFAEEYIASLGTVPEERQRVESLRLQEKLLPTSETLWGGGGGTAEVADLAAFLETNRMALDSIVAAADKPRYYVPLITLDEPPRLLAASLAIERRLSFISRVLTVRAMRRSAEGDFTAALKDFVACHKLAFLLASGSPLDVSIAKAHVVDAIACRGEVALIESGKLTADAATMFQEALSALPPLPTCDQAAEIGERAIIRQEIEFVKTDLGSVRSFFEPLKDEEFKELEGKRLGAIDWGQAFARADELQDRVVKALATRDRAKQNELFQALDVSFAEWETSSDELTKKMAENLDKDPKAASQWIGESMAMSLRPLYRQRRNTDDRARVRRDMVILGLALTRSKAANGAYPANLDDLVASKLVKEIPLDSHTDAPYVYRLSDKMNKAFLVSWGTNTQDDAGKDYNDDQVLKLP